MKRKARFINLYEVTNGDKLPNVSLTVNTDSILLTLWPRARSKSVSRGPGGPAAPGPEPHLTQDLWASPAQRRAVVAVDTTISQAGGRKRRGRKRRGEEAVPCNVRGAALPESNTAVKKLIKGEYFF